MTADSSCGGGGDTTTSVVSNDVGDVVNESRQRRLMLQLPGLTSDTTTEDAFEDELEKVAQVKQLEVTLGNLIVFVRRLCVNATVLQEVGAAQWVRLLLRITGSHVDTNLPLVSSLRTRVLTLTLLTATLPTAELEADLKTQVVRQLFSQLGAYMWVIPSAQAQVEASKLVLELNKHIERLSSPNLLYDEVPRPESPDDNLPIQEVGFDPEKTMCCSVEGGHTLVHGPGGRGYGLGSNPPITSGCFQWKFLIVKESRGYEGTCVGVSRYPVRDYSHRTTCDMWLYRAYSGNLYHNGELSLTLPGFTQGDYVTVILDMEARTLSFGKNGDEPKLAFEDIDATELYPCVMFYSTNPGEKVKMVDMQMRGSPKDLDAGEPYCAPHPAVMCETHVALIRELHEASPWTQYVNESIIERLSLARDLLPPPSPSPSPTPQHLEADDKDQDQRDEGRPPPTQSTSVEVSTTEQLCNKNSAELLIQQQQQQHNNNNQLHQQQQQDHNHQQQEQLQLHNQQQYQNQNQHQQHQHDQHQQHQQDQHQQVQHQHQDAPLSGDESDKSTSSCSTTNADDDDNAIVTSQRRRKRSNKNSNTKYPSPPSSSPPPPPTLYPQEDPTNLEQLCKEVWPALAVLGGVDGGLRVGGQCIVGGGGSGGGGRKAMVLGMLKAGQTSLKVQWCDGEGLISDCSIKVVHPLPGRPFTMSLLTGLTATGIRQLARLAALTDEVGVPFL